MVCLCIIIVSLLLIICVERTTLLFIFSVQSPLLVLLYIFFCFEKLLYCTYILLISAERSTLFLLIIRLKSPECPPHHILLREKINVKYIFLSRNIIYWYLLYLLFLNICLFQKSAFISFCFLNSII